MSETSEVGPKSTELEPVAGAVEKSEQIVSRARENLIKEKPGLRGILSRIALAGSLLFFAAAEITYLDLRNEIKARTTANLNISSEEMTQLRSSLIEMRYPLVSRGILPKDSFEVQTESGIMTSVVNYTSGEHKEGEISPIYKAVESALQDESQIAGLKYTRNGKEYGLKASPIDNLNNRVVALVPYSENLPENMRRQAASTTLYGTQDQTFAISYVKIPERQDGVLDSSLAIGVAVEACQESYNFIPIELQPSDTTNEEVNNQAGDIAIAQEIGCNSLGIAIGSRITGVPYGEYRRKLENTNYETQGANEGKLIVVDEWHYNSLLIGSQSN